MRDLAFQLKNLCREHRTGGDTTQADRAMMLQLFAEQLYALGYKKLQLPELKGRHVNKLLARWHADGVSTGTLKNRLSVLRWLYRRLGKASVIPATNAALNIPQRQYVATRSKAQDLPPDQLAQIHDPGIRLSLELQRAFGLRREESLKLKPRQADEGQWLMLQGSWTKGGRPRSIPIRTPAQRALLDRAKAFAGHGSLIPPDLKYIQQRRRYDSETHRVGLAKMHGLRHAYAQERYRELTGWDAPAAGGPGMRQLTPEQRLADHDARLRISSELGHGREQITTVYLGR
jgi:integrase